jgi:polar amino acid transport system permease protein
MNQWGVIWSVRDSFIAGLFATLELFITAALAAADYRYCAVLF